LLGYFLRGILGVVLGGISGLVLVPIINWLWIRYIFPYLVNEYFAKKNNRPKNAANGPMKLHMCTDKITALMAADFFNRLMTNRLPTMGPSITLAADETEFVNKITPNVSPGDPIVNFTTSLHPKRGRWAVLQVANNIIGKYKSMLKSGPEIIEVRIKFPVIKPGHGATEQEIEKADKVNTLMENTVGFLKQQMAIKAIGVIMAQGISNDGKLFRLDSSWGGASAHTTPIVEASDKSRKIADVEVEDVDAPELGGEDEGYNDSAMTTSDGLAGRKSGQIELNRNPGGIMMSSRLMDLKISGDEQNSISSDYKTMHVPIISSIVPKVSNIITVTPQMLKDMLGEAYLN
jgi:hypothetical protein